jgi:hypothetical protein
MQDQVGSGDAASEYRDARFAELDVQIQAVKADRRPAAGKRKRRCAGPALPREVRKEVTYCAYSCGNIGTCSLPNRKLKDRAARFLRFLLSPKRKRGRPGLPSVSKAILLVKRFRHQYPNEKPELIWKRVYRKAIPGYVDMDRERQKAERLLLRERVRSRGKQARRTV